MFSFLIFKIIFAFSAQAKTLQGVATSINDSKIVYLEEHHIEMGENGLNKKIETKYYTPEKKLFAEMTSDFSKNSTLPIVKFTDSRFNRVEEFTFDASGQHVIFTTKKMGQEMSSKKIPIANNMAAGQGFDNFIKINFEKLQKKPVSLQFGVLSEMDFFSFKGYKKKDVSAKSIQFGIDLSSFLLRFFSKELILEYDIEKKEILSYQGLSNILNDEGKPQSVLIKYSSSTKSEARE